MVEVGSNPVPNLKTSLAKSSIFSQYKYVVQAMIKYYYLIKFMLQIAEFITTNSLATLQIQQGRGWNNKYADYQAGYMAKSNKPKKTDYLTTELLIGQISGIVFVCRLEPRLV